MMNIYRVLLTRAKKGVGIWFKDLETKQHFESICLREKNKCIEMLFRLIIFKVEIM